MTTIQILHTNDLHSRFANMPAIASCIKQLRDAHEGPTIVCDIGDHIDRSHKIAEGTGGEANTAVLNATGVDYFVLGNNEGLALTHGQLGMLLGEKAAFATLGTNLFVLDSGQHPGWVKPFEIREFGGTRVAFFGLTASLQRYYKLLNWDVREPIALMRAAMDDLRGTVDAVVVLSHLGKDVDAELAEQVPGITCILGGHTHHVFAEAVMVNGAALCGAGKFGQYVGEVKLTFEEGQAVRVDACLHETAAYAADADVAAVIAHYEQLADAHLTEPIAHLPQAIPHHYGADSPLGNLLAQAVRERTGADFALVNNGQFLEGFAEGEVTKDMLLKRCPSPVQVCRMKLNGKAIRWTLEESLLEEKQNYRFQGFGFRGDVLGGMSVDGIEIEYNPTGPDMGRIQRILIDGEPLDETKDYLIGTLDLFTFGVGYKRLQEGHNMEFYLPSFIRDVLTPVLREPHWIDRARLPRWLHNSSVNGENVL